MAITKFGTVERFPNGRLQFVGFHFTDQLPDVRLDEVVEEAKRQDRYFEATSRTER